MRSPITQGENFDGYIVKNLTANELVKRYSYRKIRNYIEDIKRLENMRNSLRDKRKHAERRRKKSIFSIRLITKDVSKRTDKSTTRLGPAGLTSNYISSNQVTYPTSGLLGRYDATDDNVEETSSESNADDSEVSIVINNDDYTDNSDSEAFSNITTPMKPETTASMTTLTTDKGKVTTVMITEATQAPNITKHTKTTKSPSGSVKIVSNPTVTTETSSSNASDPIYRVGKDASPTTTTAKYEEFTIYFDDNHGTSITPSDIFFDSTIKLALGPKILEIKASLNKNDKMNAQIPTNNVVVRQTQTTNDTGCDSPVAQSSTGACVNTMQDTMDSSGSGGSSPAVPYNVDTQEEVGSPDDGGASSAPIAANKATNERVYSVRDGGPSSAAAAANKDTNENANSAGNVSTSATAASTAEQKEKAYPTGAGRYNYNDDATTGQASSQNSGNANTQQTHKDAKTDTSTTSSTNPTTETTLVPTTIKINPMTPDSKATHTGRYEFNDPNVDKAPSASPSPSQSPSPTQSQSKSQSQSQSQSQSKSQSQSQSESQSQSQSQSQSPSLSPSSAQSPSPSRPPSPSPSPSPSNADKESKESLAAHGGGKMQEQKLPGDSTRLQPSPVLSSQNCSMPTVMIATVAPGTACARVLNVLRWKSATTPSYRYEKRTSACSNKPFSKCNNFFTTTVPKIIGYVLSNGQVVNIDKNKNRNDDEDYVEYPKNYTDFKLIENQTERVEPRSTFKRFEDMTTSLKDNSNIWENTIDGSSFSVHEHSLDNLVQTSMSMKALEKSKEEPPTPNVMVVPPISYQIITSDDDYTNNSDGDNTTPNENQFENELKVKRTTNSNTLVPLQIKTTTNALGLCNNVDIGELLSSINRFAQSHNQNPSNLQEINVQDLLRQETTTVRSVESNDLPYFYSSNDMSTVCAKDSPLFAQPTLYGLNNNDIGDSVSFSIRNVDHVLPDKHDSTVKSTSCIDYLLQTEKPSTEDIVTQTEEQNLKAFNVLEIFKNQLQQNAIRDKLRSGETTSEANDMSLLDTVKTNHETTNDLSLHTFDTKGILQDSTKSLIKRTTNGLNNIVSIETTKTTRKATTIDLNRLFSLDLRNNIEEEIAEPTSGNKLSTTSTPKTSLDSNDSDGWGNFYTVRDVIYDGLQTTPEIIPPEEILAIAASDATYNEEMNAKKTRQYYINKLMQSNDTFGDIDKLIHGEAAIEHPATMGNSTRVILQKFEIINDITSTTTAGKDGLAGDDQATPARHGPTQSKGHTQGKGTTSVRGHQGKAVKDDRQDLLKGISNQTLLHRLLSSNDTLGDIEMLIHGFSVVVPVLDLDIPDLLNHLPKFITPATSEELRSLSVAKKEISENCGNSSEVTEVTSAYAVVLEPLQDEILLEKPTSNKRMDDSTTCETTTCRTTINASFDTGDLMLAPELIMDFLGDSRDSVTECITTAPETTTLSSKENTREVTTPMNTIGITIDENTEDFFPYCKTENEEFHKQCTTADYQTEKMLPYSLEEHAVNPLTYRSTTQENNSSREGTTAELLTSETMPYSLEEHGLNPLTYRSTTQETNSSREGTTAEPLTSETMPYSLEEHGLNPLTYRSTTQETNSSREATTAEPLTSKTMPYSVEEHGVNPLTYPSTTQETNSSREATTAEPLTSETEKCPTTKKIGTIVGMLEPMEAAPTTMHIEPTSPKNPQQVLSEDSYKPGPITTPNNYNYTTTSTSTQTTETTLQAGCPEQSPTKTTCGAEVVQLTSIAPTNQEYDIGKNFGDGDVLGLLQHLDSLPQIEETLKASEQETQQLLATANSLPLGNLTNFLPEKGASQQAGQLDVSDNSSSPSITTRSYTLKTMAPLQGATVFEAVPESYQKSETKTIITEATLPPALLPVKTVAEFSPTSTTREASSSSSSKQPMESNSDVEVAWPGPAALQEQSTSPKPSVETNVTVHTDYSVPYVRITITQPCECSTPNITNQTTHAGCDDFTTKKRKGTREQSMVNVRAPTATTSEGEDVVSTTCNTTEITEDGEITEKVITEKEKVVSVIYTTEITEDDETTAKAPTTTEDENVVSIINNTTEITNDGATTENEPTATTNISNTTETTEDGETIDEEISTTLENSDNSTSCNDKTTMIGHIAGMLQYQETLPHFDHENQSVHRPTQYAPVPYKPGPYEVGSVVLSETMKHQKPRKKCNTTYATTTTTKQTSSRTTVTDDYPQRVSSDTFFGIVELEQQTSPWKSMRKNAKRNQELPSSSTKKLKNIRHIRRRKSNDADEEPDYDEYTEVPAINLHYQDDADTPDVTTKTSLPPSTINSEELILNLKPNMVLSLFDEELREHVVTRALPTTTTVRKLDDSDELFVVDNKDQTVNEVIVSRHSTARTSSTFEPGYQIFGLKNAYLRQQSRLFGKDYKKRSGDTTVGYNVLTAKRELNVEINNRGVPKKVKYKVVTSNNTFMIQNTSSADSGDTPSKDTSGDAPSGLPISGTASSNEHYSKAIQPNQNAPLLGLLTNNKSKAELLALMKECIRLLSPQGSQNNAESHQPVHKNSAVTKKQHALDIVAFNKKVGQFGSEVMPNHDKNIFSYTSERENIIPSGRNSEQMASTKFEGFPAVIRNVNKTQEAQRTPIKTSTKVYMASTNTPRSVTTQQITQKSVAPAIFKTATATPTTISATTTTTTATATATTTTTTTAATTATDEQTTTDNDTTAVLFKALLSANDTLEAIDTLINSYTTNIVMMLPQMPTANSPYTFYSTENPFWYTQPKNTTTKGTSTIRYDDVWYPYSAPRSTRSTSSATMTRTITSTRETPRTTMRTTLQTTSKRNTQKEVKKYHVVDNGGVPSSTLDDLVDNKPPRYFSYDTEEQGSKIQVKSSTRQVGGGGLLTESVTDRGVGDILHLTTTSLTNVTTMATDSMLQNTQQTRETPVDRSHVTREESTMNHHELKASKILQMLIANIIKQALIKQYLVTNRPNGDVLVSLVTQANDPKLYENTRRTSDSTKESQQAFVTQPDSPATKHGIAFVPYVTQSSKRTADNANENQNKQPSNIEKDVIHEVTSHSDKNNVMMPESSPYNQQSQNLPHTTNKESNPAVKPTPFNILLTEETNQAEIVYEDQIDQLKAQSDAYRTTTPNSMSPLSMIKNMIGRAVHNTNFNELTSKAMLVSSKSITEEGFNRTVETARKFIPREAYVTSTEISGNYTSPDSANSIQEAIKLLKRVREDIDFTPFDYGNSKDLNSSPMLKEKLEDSTKLYFSDPSAFVDTNGADCVSGSINCGTSEYMPASVEYFTTPDRLVGSDNLVGASNCGPTCMPSSDIPMGESMEETTDYFMTASPLAENNYADLVTASTDYGTLNDIPSAYNSLWETNETSTEYQNITNPQPSMAAKDEYLYSPWIKEGSTDHTTTSHIVNAEIEETTTEYITEPTTTTDTPYKIGPVLDPSESISRVNRIITEENGMSLTSISVQKTKETTTEYFTEPTPGTTPDKNNDIDPVASISRLTRDPTGRDYIADTISNNENDLLISTLKSQKPTSSQSPVSPTISYKLGVNDKKPKEEFKREPNTVLPTSLMTPVRREKNELPEVTIRPSVNIPIDFRADQAIAAVMASDDAVEAVDRLIHDKLVDEDISNNVERVVQNIQNGPCTDTIDSTAELFQAIISADDSLAAIERLNHDNKEPLRNVERVVKESPGAMSDSFLRDSNDIIRNILGVTTDTTVLHHHASLEGAEEEILITQCPKTTSRYEMETKVYHLQPQVIVLPDKREEDIMTDSGRTVNIPFPKMTKFEPIVEPTKRRAGKYESKTVGNDYNDDDDTPSRLEIDVNTRALDQNNYIDYRTVKYLENPKSMDHFLDESRQNLQRIKRSAPNITTGQSFLGYAGQNSPNTTTINFKNSNSTFSEVVLTKSEAPSTQTYNASKYPTGNFLGKLLQIENATRTNNKTQMLNSLEDILKFLMGIVEKYKYELTKTSPTTESSILTTPEVYATSLMTQEICTYPMFIENAKRSFRTIEMTTGSTPTTNSDLNTQQMTTHSVSKELYDIIDYISKNPDIFQIVQTGNAEEMTTEFECNLLPNERTLRYTIPQISNFDVTAYLSDSLDMFETTTQLLNLPLLIDYSDVIKQGTYPQNFVLVLPLSSTYYPTTFLQPYFKFKRGFPSGDPLITDSSCPTQSISDWNTGTEPTRTSTRFTTESTKETPTTNALSIILFQGATLSNHTTPDLTTAPMTTQSTTDAENTTCNGTGPWANWKYSKMGGNTSEYSVSTVVPLTTSTATTTNATTETTVSSVSVPNDTTPELLDVLFGTQLLDMRQFQSQTRVCTENLKSPLEEYGLVNPTLIPTDPDDKEAARSIPLTSNVKNKVNENNNLYRILTNPTSSYEKSIMFKRTMDQTSKPIVKMDINARYVLTNATNEPPTTISATKEPQTTTLKPESDTTNIEFPDFGVPVLLNTKSPSEVEEELATAPYMVVVKQMFLESNPKSDLPSINWPRSSFAIGNSQPIVNMSDLLRAIYVTEKVPKLPRESSAGAVLTYVPPQLLQTFVIPNTTNPTTTSTQKQTTTAKTSSNGPLQPVIIMAYLPPTNQQIPFLPPYMSQIFQNLTMLPQLQSSPVLLNTTIKISTNPTTLKVTQTLNYTQLTQTPAKPIVSTSIPHTARNAQDFSYSATQSIEAPVSSKTEKNLKILKAAKDLLRLRRLANKREQPSIIDNNRFTNSIPIIRKYAIRNLRPVLDDLLLQPFGDNELGVPNYQPFIVQRPEIIQYHEIVQPLKNHDNQNSQYDDNKNMRPIITTNDRYLPIVDNKEQENIVCVTKPTNDFTIYQYARSSNRVKNLEIIESTKTPDLQKILNNNAEVKPLQKDKYAQYSNPQPIVDSFTTHVVPQFFLPQVLQAMPFIHGVKANLSQQSLDTTKNETKSTSDTQRNVTLISSPATPTSINNTHFSTTVCNPENLNQSNKTNNILKMLMKGYTTCVALSLDMAVTDTQGTKPVQNNITKTPITQTIIPKTTLQMVENYTTSTTNTTKNEIASTFGLVSKLISTIAPRTSNVAENTTVSTKTTDKYVVGTTNILNSLSSVSKPKSTTDTFKNKSSNTTELVSKIINTTAPQTSKVTENTTIDTETTVKHYVVGTTNKPTAGSSVSKDDTKILPETTKKLYTIPISPYVDKTTIVDLPTTKTTGISSACKRVYQATTKARKIAKDKSHATEATTQRSISATRNKKIINTTGLRKYRARFLSSGVEISRNVPPDAKKEIVKVIKEYDKNNKTRIMVSVKFPNYRYKIPSHINGSTDFDQLKAKIGDTSRIYNKKTGDSARRKKFQQPMLIGKNSGHPVNRKQRQWCTVPLTKEKGEMFLPQVDKNTVQAYPILATKLDLSMSTEPSCVDKLKNLVEDELMRKFLLLGNMTNTYVTQWALKDVPSTTYYPQWLNQRLLYPEILNSLRKMQYPKFTTTIVHTTRMLPPLPPTTQRILAKTLTQKTGLTLPSLPEVILPTSTTVNTSKTITLPPILTALLPAMPHPTQLSITTQATNVFTALKITQPPIVGTGLTVAGITPNPNIITQSIQAPAPVAPVVFIPGNAGIPLNLNTSQTTMGFSAVRVVGNTVAPVVSNPTQITQPPIAFTGYPIPGNAALPPFSNTIKSPGGPTKPLPFVFPKLSQLLLGCGSNMFPMKDILDSIEGNSGTPKQDVTTSTIKLTNGYQPIIMVPEQLPIANTPLPYLETMQQQSTTKAAQEFITTYPTITIQQTTIAPSTVATQQQLIIMPAQQSTINMPQRLETTSRTDTLQQSTKTIFQQATMPTTQQYITTEPFTVPTVEQSLTTPHISNTSVNISVLEYIIRRIPDVNPSTLEYILKAIIEGLSKLYQENNFHNERGQLMNSLVASNTVPPVTTQVPPPNVQNVLTISADASIPPGNAATPSENQPLGTTIANLAEESTKNLFPTAKSADVAQLDHIPNLSVINVKTSEIAPCLAQTTKSIVESTLLENFSNVIIPTSSTTSTVFQNLDQTTIDLYGNIQLENPAIEKLQFFGNPTPLQSTINLTTSSIITPNILDQTAIDLSILDMLIGGEATTQTVLTTPQSVTNLTSLRTSVNTDASTIDLAILESILQACESTTYNNLPAMYPNTGHTTIDLSILENLLAGNVTIPSNFAFPTTPRLEKATRMVQLAPVKISAANISVLENILAGYTTSSASDTSIPIQNDINSTIFDINLFDSALSAKEGHANNTLSTTVSPLMADQEQGNKTINQGTTVHKTESTAFTYTTSRPTTCFIVNSHTTFVYDMNRLADSFVNGNETTPNVCNTTSGVTPSIIYDTTCVIYNRQTRNYLSSTRNTTENSINDTSTALATASCATAAVTNETRLKAGDTGIDRNSTPMSKWKKIFRFSKKNATTPTIVPPISTVKSKERKNLKSLCNSSLPSDPYQCTALYQKLIVLVTTTSKIKTRTPEPYITTKAQSILLTTLNNAPNTSPRASFALNQGTSTLAKTTYKPPTTPLAQTLKKPVIVSSYSPLPKISTTTVKTKTKSGFINNCGTSTHRITTSKLTNTSVKTFANFANVQVYAKASPNTLITIPPTTLRPTITKATSYQFIRPTPVPTTMPNWILATLATTEVKTETSQTAQSFCTTPTSHLSYMTVGYDQKYSPITTTTRLTTVDTIDKLSTRIPSLLRTSYPPDLRIEIKPGLWLYPGTSTKRDELLFRHI